MSSTASDHAEVPGLPPAVWSRVVALTAQALPAMASPPASLRKLASFTPSRRARVGAARIGDALADDDFRERTATLVAAGRPELAEQVRHPPVPDGADPVEVAALAWLMRPERWEEVLADAVRRVAARQDAAADARDAGEMDRLRHRLEEGQAASRDQQARHSEALDQLRGANADLRRKLGEARAGERAARRAADEAAQEARSLRAESTAAVAAAESEARRLRAQLEELNDALAAARRASRNHRGDATVRARLLLDTLLEAGQGLRRELALPAAEGTPADRLEAELAGPEAPAAAGSLGADGPHLLEQYLALPRARLIVDGYNVSKQALPDSTLASQRSWLVTRLAALVARTRAETTVVFDAADSVNRPLVTPPRGVKVIFSPVGVIADDVIRDLLAVEPGGRVVVVVTSDQEVAADVRRAGARAMSAAALVEVLGR